jgi:site-specific DNA recombinase
MSVPAVAYYRMSTDRQETSIPEQREAVQAYAAKNGLRILREYKDEGISGDDTTRRLSFQRMLADAKELGDFQAVVSWDQDRFGRFDPLEAGYWIKPLRDAGVRLETCAQGRIDWEDFAGRLIYAVTQEGKHAFLRDLSRNSMRGMLRAAKEGKWVGGKPPLGYAVAEQRLVPGDPTKVEAVRWIFRTYAHTDTSLGSMAASLNKRGIAPPGGKKLWHKTTVLKIIENPLYTGVFVWNRRRMGKYHAVSNGEITPMKRRRSQEANDAGHWIVLPGSHEPLVDRETYDRAQARRTERRHRKTPHADGGNFLFTRLIFCGHCGAPMHGVTMRMKHKDKKTGRLVSNKVYSYRRYICAKYNAHGRQACSCNTIPESQLVNAVARKLRELFQVESNRKALVAELKARIIGRGKGQDDQGGEIRRELADLEKKIDQGAERVLSAPPSLTKTLTAKLETWQAKKDTLQAALASLAPRQAVSEADIDSKVAAAVKKLSTFEQGLQKGNPAKAREVLRQFIARIDCWFNHVPFGKGRTRSVLKRGIIQLRPDLLLYRDVASASPLTIVKPARDRSPANRSAMRRPYEVQWREPTMATAFVSLSCRLPRR